MKRAIHIICGVLLALVLGAMPASAQETRSITLQTIQGPQVVRCVEGGQPPCRLTYSGDENGSPFTDFAMYRQPARVEGYLDLVEIDPATGCYPSVFGVFEIRSRRGAREFLAFKEVVSGSYCVDSFGNGAFSGAYRIDSDDAQDASFRHSTGSGVMQLRHSLTSGVFSRRDSGQITTRH